MAVREIVELGHPALRERAQKVKDVFEPEIQTLIDDMIDTLKKAKGMGLAATQIGVPLRIFIVTPEGHLRYPHSTLDEGLVVINPTLKPVSKRMQVDWEGCLSIPGIRGQVPRPAAVEVRYTNRLGEECTGVFEDYIGRIFFHENDHLDGVVFTDRMKNMKTLVTDKEYMRIMHESA